MSKRTNGMGTIAQDPKTKRWVARITIGTDAKGRPIRRKFTAKTEVEAQARLDAARKAHKAGLPIAPERLTVADWMDEYLPHHGATKAPNTDARYQCSWRLHIKPYLGRVRLLTLRPMEVEQWLATLGAQGLASATVNMAHRVLKLGINGAVRQGLLDRNVAAMAKGMKVSHRAVEGLDAFQAKALLAAAAAPALRLVGQPGRASTAVERLGPAIYVMVGLGFRRGEALGLRWSDLDLAAEPATVRLQRQLTYVSGHGLTFGPTKTKVETDLSVPAIVADALRALRARQAAARLSLGGLWQDVDLVFTTDMGGPVHPDNFSKFVVTVAERAGLSGVTSHKLRHTFVTLALEAGQPLHDVSKAVTHARMSTTIDIYGHFTKVRQDGVASAMDGVLSGS